MLKALFATMSLFLSLNVFAEQPGDLVTMISRYVQGGSYERTATYSFRAMTHDVNVTGNNWDVLFEGRADMKQDEFRVNTVTDDRSAIYDLSAAPSGDCTSPAWNRSKENDNIPVIEGHTYLVESSDTAGSVRATFKVEKHIKGYLVVISDIQILSQTGKARR